MPQVILFDIDYTLLDSAALRKLRRNALIKEIGVPKAEFNEVLFKYTSSLKSSTDFNPSNFLNQLSIDFGHDLDKLESIFYDNRSYIRSIYPETIDTLEKLHSKYLLGIFSEGIKEHQKKKLLLSNLEKYLNRKFVFIFKRKLSNNSLAKIPKNAIIVDDNPEVIVTLQKHKFPNVYHLNRKNSKADGIIHAISSLNELLTNI
jgi:hypothetical protein